ncbi:hypothetical protein JCM10213_008149 [Rhodosporidiobolus nylandii]
MPMPPAFFLSPPGFPHSTATAQGGGGPYKVGEDVWDEVAERSYSGYSMLAPIQASTTALTPLAENPPSAGYDYSTGQLQRYRDADGEEGGKAEGEEEGDWMDKYRLVEVGEGEGK